ncbi:RNA helicase [Malassezia furfur]|uniref:ATP-dependent DNA helicase CHL1 n=1 Tax=Malassezia furfur TaxID=55194 RepID=A0ABY8EY20_MALFU|nr:RNA helicase [Malassezia furfur]
MPTLEDDAAHLALAVPDGDDAEARSRAFHFPYPIAYDVQLALMTALFDAIEHRRAGVFESPTGTGKTLSLLCSAFTWLQLNQHRAQLGTAQPNDADEPDWVVAHDEAARRARLAAHDTELNDKLRAIRARTQPASASRAPKKRRVDDTDAADSDSEFLVADFDEHRPRAARNARAPPTDDAPYVSDEVRAMMHAFESSLAPPRTDEPVHTTPQIYYASRTHSQLAQLIHELKRTPFGHDAHDVVRTISLGSRRQMCINAHVQRVGATFGMEAMNERCLELMESRSQKRCPYLPPADAAGDAKMDTFRDHALAHVRDIEELVALGKEMHVCPYFGARRAVADAQLIALPYNLLLQQDAREALALHLDDSVIIIDEAHNLIDTLLGTYSVEVGEAHLAQAAHQVTAYLDRFAMQLKGTNEEHLRTLQVFLTAAQAFCVHAKAPDALSTADFVARLGGSVDQINFLRLELWLKETRIARKISGYADKLWLRAHPNEPPSRHNHVHAMHLVERLLLALGDRTRNGRILVARRPDKRVSIKYILLNPADAFQPLLDAARSVVLAGGTMAPIAEFERQLFAHDPARFTSYSCGHIVAPANVLGAVVAAGPKGLPLEFTHAAWDNAALLDELGNALSNYCNLVPHGMIVFFPSYTNLHKTLAHWRSTRLLERLAKRKRVFQEPTDAHDVDAVLQGYAAAIASPTPDAPKGAILFAVVNAKLSEGINFQDDLARCVVMVGLPFPNAHSPELAERMAYMRQLDPRAKTDLGRDLYLNLCMRAVNQSMGRAIRHEHDYAAFLLLDHRYSRKEVAARMPQWIGTQTRTHERFGTSISALAAFFRAKKQGTS